MIANMEVYKTDKTIREVTRVKTDFSEEELNKLVDARKMTEVLEYVRVSFD